MPHGITQCCLPPGRGDIPALTPAEAGTRLSDPGEMQVFLFASLYRREKVGKRERVLDLDIYATCIRGSVAEWLACWTLAQKGPVFKSQSRRCRVTVLGKLFTPIVRLFTKQRNW